MKNNKYLIEFDFLIFSCLMLMACIIIWVVALLIQRNERFNAMQYTVISLTHYATIYDIQSGINNEEKISIGKLNETGITHKIINPFDPEQYCNDDSFITKKDNNIYVTLNCGNYWVYDYSSKTSFDMKIYKKGKFNEILVKKFTMKESETNETK